MPTIPQQFIGARSDFSNHPERTLMISREVVGM